MVRKFIMKTQVDPKFDVSEDLNSILMLTQFALLGGSQECEFLESVAKYCSNSNVKSYVKWLLGDDSTFNEIKESAKPWFRNVAKYSSLYCLVAAGYGYEKVKFRFPESEVRKKFMRIGMWPTRFKDAGAYQYDDLEPSHDPLSKIQTYYRSFKPEDVNKGIVWINLFSLYPDIVSDVVNCLDISSSPLYLENEDQRHSLACCLLHWEITTKTLNPKGESLAQFLVNLSKLYRYPSYDTLCMFAQPSDFTDDQLIKLINAGFQYLPSELGKRGTRLPKELRHFEKKLEGEERDAKKDQIIHKIRQSWVYGVLELAQKHILELTKNDRYGYSDLDRVKLLCEREIDYIVNLFHAEIAPFIRVALMNLLCEKEIRIYSHEKPLDPWIIGNEEVRSLTFKYMDAAAFITYYYSSKKL